jgi:hypothetical protein
MHAPHVASGGRYPVLRSLAILYLFAAAVVLVVGVWQAISVLMADSAMTDNVFGTTTGTSGKLLVAVSWLAASFIGVLVMLGVAELIKLFIDMEHNTRVAAMQRSVGAPAAEAVVVSGPDGVAVVATPATTASASDNRGGRVGQWLEGEETAEGALLRGH